MYLNCAEVEMDGPPQNKTLPEHVLIVYGYPPGPAGRSSRQGARPIQKPAWRSSRPSSLSKLRPRLYRIRI